MTLTKFRDSYLNVKYIKHSIRFFCIELWIHKYGLFRLVSCSNLDQFYLCSNRRRWKMHVCNISQRVINHTLTFSNQFSIYTNFVRYFPCGEICIQTSVSSSSSRQKFNSQNLRYSRTLRIVMLRKLNSSKYLLIFWITDKYINRKSIFIIA